MTLIEAMASGLPVVSTEVGGVPEVVVNNATGLLAPAGDADRLASQVLRLVDNPDLRAKLGQAGRERALAHFSEDAMIEAYSMIYLEAARGRARRTASLASGVES